MKALIILCSTFLLIGCSATKNKAAEAFLKDQVQLDLQGKVKPARIVASFPSMGLRHLCTLSEEDNIVIFSFDLQQKSLEEMIAFLSKEVGIEGVSRTVGCK